MTKGPDKIKIAIHSDFYQINDKPAILAGFHIYELKYFIIN